MSALIYNNISLPLSDTTEFRQEAVYDDSNTDLLFTKFDITVECILNSANLTNIILPPLAIPENIGTNPANIMLFVRKRLMTPKKRLYFLTNGVDLIAKVAELKGDVDAKNGPQPQACVITRLASTTFKLNYRIIAHYWERPELSPDGVTDVTYNTPSNPVLSNRWTERVEIDGMNYTRRIREGKYIIASNNNVGKIVDEFREQMAVVGVPEGFVRESADYTVQPDGLALQYRIVDREVFKMPPSGAYKATGSYSESAPQWNATRILTVRIRLEGDKLTPQADLIRTAILVARAKLSQQQQVLIGDANMAASGNNNPGIIAESMNLGVDMYANAVEVEMGARVMASNARFSALEMPFDDHAFTPGSDPQGFAPTPTYFDRGTAGLLLNAAAYYDPSLTNTVLNPEEGQLSQGKQVGTAGVNGE